MVTKIHKPSKFARFVLYPLAFLAFLFIFFIVLTYANGYRIDRKDGKLVLQKTGIMIVATRPGEAQIVLNGKNTNKLTTFPFLPVKINNLLPTTYKLELVREGFRKWENNVKVQSNYVTWVNYVLLFPNDLKIAKVDPLEGKTVIAQSKNNRYLFVSGTEQNVASYYLFDTNNNNLEKVWPKKTSPTESYLANPVFQSVQFSENNDKLIARVQNGSMNDFVTIDLNGTDGKVVSLNTYYKTTLDRVVPDPLDASFVFGVVGKNLYRLNLNIHPDQ
jgi:hypothetical protein